MVQATLCSSPWWTGAVCTPDMPGRRGPVAALLGELASPCILLTLCGASGSDQPLLLLWQMMAAQGIHGLWPSDSGLRLALPLDKRGLASSTTLQRRSGFLAMISSPAGAVGKPRCRRRSCREGRAEGLEPRLITGVPDAQQQQNI